MIGDVLSQDCASELARVGSAEKKCYPIGDQLFCKECNIRRTGKEHCLVLTFSWPPNPGVDPDIMRQILYYDIWKYLMKFIISVGVHCSNNMVLVRGV